jgi:uncharacterized protein (DUF1810 family)
LINHEEGFIQEGLYNLSRFVKAQEGVYKTALRELNNGRKETHWMWFIFPQVDGLASSSMSQYYSIKSLEEARQYLAHPILGRRLLECTGIVLGLNQPNIMIIFDFPDNLKFHSCMTLFALVDKNQDVFARNLNKYFSGKMDTQTLAILESLKALRVDP